MGMNDLIRKWADELRAQDYAAQTVKAKASAVSSVSRWAGVDPDRLTREDVLAWLEAASPARWTRLKYLEHLRAFCRWAGVPDCTEGVRRPPQPTGLPRPVDEAQLRRIIAATETQRELVWVLLGAYCGLRAHESAKIAWEDMWTAEDGTVLLRVLGKGQQLAVVPMPDVVCQALQPLCDASATGAGRLWPRASAASVQETMRRLSVRSKVRFTSHQLRHRYGTAFYDASRDLLATQQAMRHRSPATTAGYALVVADRIADIARRLPGA